MTAEIIQGSMDRGFGCAVNMEAELYAHADGLVYPIEKWYGVDGDECAKGDAIFAIAGRGFRWFNVHLGLFGLGPWAARYEDPAFVERMMQNESIVKRVVTEGASDSGSDPKGEDPERSEGLSAEHRRAATATAGASPRILLPNHPSETNHDEGERAGAVPVLRQRDEI